MRSRFDGDDRVKVVELTKGDRFYFSRKYDDSRIDPLIDKHMQALSIMNSLPTADKAYGKIKELEKRGLWGTAVIEGNPMAEEVAVDLLGRTSIKGTLDQASQEIVNIREAYDAVDSLSYDEASGFILTEKMVIGFHKTLTKKLKHKYNEPGKYRNIDNYPDVDGVKVGSVETGGIYKPPMLLKDIKVLMKVFVEWINSKEVMALHPFVRAALAHYHFSLIHPFWDGNGRTARLIEAVIIHSHGIKYLPKIVSKHYHNDQKEYYQSFRLCERDKDKNVGDFIVIVGTCFVSAMEEVLDIINDELFRLVLLNRVDNLVSKKELKLRHRNLIEAMIDQPAALTINELRNEFPFSLIYGEMSLDTVRRDVKKMISLNLVHETEEGFAVKKGGNLLFTSGLLTGKM